MSLTLTEKEYDRIYAIRYREDVRFPTTPQEDDALTKKIIMILLMNTEIKIPDELTTEFEKLNTQRKLDFLEGNLPKEDQSRVVDD